MSLQELLINVMHPRQMKFDEIKLYCVVLTNFSFLSFFKSHKITGALYDSVIRFYVFRWKLTKGFDQDKLTEYLPSSLVGDISTVLYADFIAKVKYSLGWLF